MSKKTRRNRFARSNPPLYMNAYQVDRAYGGPEEGGWWFDYGITLASRKVRRSEKKPKAMLDYDFGHYVSPKNGKLIYKRNEKARHGCHIVRARPRQVRLMAITAQVEPEFRTKQTQVYKRQFAHLDDPHGIDSVLCQGVVQMYVERHPGRNFPQEAPHYE